MTEPALVRPLATADLAAVEALVAALPTAPRWSPAAWAAVLEPAAPPRHIALAAELRGRLAGFAVLSLLAPDAELETICVDPACQRQGLGRQLLSAATAQLRLQGVTRIFLEVRASNLPALALYHALGFAVAGRRSRYYSGPEEDALLLQLALGAL